MPLIAGATLILVTGLLSAIAYRGTRVVGFDPHYYLEYAKQFRTELPASFGTHWPFGFSLLGTGVSRLGFSAFASLLLVTSAAWGAVGALLWRPLRATFGRTDLTLVAIVAFGTTAIAIIEMGALRSEIAFTALSTAALIAIAESDTPRAWLAAALAVLLGFCLRYAGVLGFAFLGLWFLLRQKWPWYRGATALKAALVGAAVLICGLLMLWNIATRGYASGAARSDGPGLAGLGEIFSELGWGGLVAFTSIGIHNALAHSFLERPIGWLMVVLAALLAHQAWHRPRSIYSQPFALGLIVYMGGMAAFAAMRNFDPLSSGRTLIPALPLFFVLALEWWRPRSVSLVLGAAFLFSLPGIFVTARGISPQIAPDFRPALQVLTPRLAPTDSIGVNLPAVGLSAWVDQKVSRIDDSTLPLITHRWLVLSADLEGGRAAIPVWTPASLKLREELKTGHQFEPVFENAQLSVWQRLSAVVPLSSP